MVREGECTGASRRSYVIPSVVSHPTLLPRPVVAAHGRQPARSTPRMQSALTAAPNRQPATGEIQGGGGRSALPMSGERTPLGEAMIGHCSPRSGRLPGINGESCPDG